MKNENNSPHLKPLDSIRSTNMVNAWSILVSNSRINTIISKLKIDALVNLTTDEKTFDTQVINEEKSLSNFLNNPRDWLVSGIIQNFS
jgi:hypothetical protein